MAQIQLLLAREVEQPPRGADDDVDALLERLDLRLVRPAAVDGENAYVTDLAGRQQVVRHLLAQLARRDDDEGLRGLGELLGLGAAGLDVGGDGHALKERETETERLAGAGLGLADDVRAAEGDRERHLLDGKGGDDADGFERLGGLGQNSEIPESRSQGNASSVYAVRGERGGRVGTGPGTSAASRAGRVARDHCRRSSARTAEGPSEFRTHRAVRTRRAVGSEPIGPPTGHPHSCGPSSYVFQLSGRITTIPRNRAHAMADSVT